MKQFALPLAFSLAFLAGTPALADNSVSAEAKAETKSSRTFGDRVKALFGFGDEKATKVADQAKGKSEEAKDEAKGHSDAAHEHAAEVKAEGQAKAESAKDEGSNKQGASESAKDEGDNRQGAGLGLGADVSIETRGKDK